MVSVMKRNTGRIEHWLVAWRDPTTFQVARKSFRTKAVAVAFLDTRQTQNRQDMASAK